MQVDNMRLADELETQKLNLRDINEFLTNELKVCQYRRMHTCNPWVLPTHVHVGVGTPTHITLAIRCMLSFHTRTAMWLYCLSPAARQMTEAYPRLLPAHVQSCTTLTTGAVTDHDSPGGQSAGAQRNDGGRAQGARGAHARAGGLSKQAAELLHGRAEGGGGLRRFRKTAGHELRLWVDTRVNMHACARTMSTWLPPALCALARVGALSKSCGAARTRARAHTGTQAHMRTHTRTHNLRATSSLLPTSLHSHARVR